jgi:hypothetical protein
MTLLMRPYRLGSVIMQGPVSDEPSIPLRVPFDPGSIPPGQLTPVQTFPGRICPAWGCNGPTYPVGVNPINYIPVSMPAPVPTSDGTTPVTALSTVPSPGPTVIVSPTGGPIPAPNTPIVAAAPASTSLSDFLTGSLFGGIPNWLLLAGGAALLFLGDKK